MADYGEDLAYIHDVGFGDFSRKAAPGLLALMAEAGVTSGRVLDLGCGSGIWAGELIRAGFKVIGQDLSAAMIAIAEKRAPGADLRVGSFLDTELPDGLDAITAIGECFNYAFDERVVDGGLPAFLRRAHDALRPGGALICDVVGPAAVPEGGLRDFTEGDGWTVLVDSVAEDRMLIRRIVTFRAAGDGFFRRGEEMHTQRLYPRAEMAAVLVGAGFSVRGLDRYGELPMLPGRTAFVATKPS